MNPRSRTFVTALLLAALLSLSACAGAMDDAGKLMEYDFGTDKIPTINAVLGAERKVTGVDVGTSDGVQYKEYSYQSTSMSDDLAAYTMHLRDNGWIVIKEYNFNQAPGEGQIAIESADAGKILIISIAYDTAGYAIRVNKLEGELTRN